LDAPKPSPNGTHCHAKGKRKKCPGEPPCKDPREIVSEEPKKEPGVQSCKITDGTIPNTQGCECGASQCILADNSGLYCNKGQCTRLPIGTESCLDGIAKQITNTAQEELSEWLKKEIREKVNLASFPSFEQWCVLLIGNKSTGQFARAHNKLKLELAKDSKQAVEDYYGKINPSGDIVGLSYTTSNTERINELERQIRTKTSELTRTRRPSKQKEIDEQRASLRKQRTAIEDWENWWAEEVPALIGQIIMKNIKIDKAITYEPQWFRNYFPTHYVNPSEDLGESTIQTLYTRG